MFKQAIRNAGLPKYLGSDHDPLYRFHQWEANLRVLGVTEIKTVPYTPWSHPVCRAPNRNNPQRVLGPVVVLDSNGFRNEIDSLSETNTTGIGVMPAWKGETPIATSESRGASLHLYRWQPHCRGLYETPMAA